MRPRPMKPHVLRLMGEVANPRQGDRTWHCGGKGGSCEDDGLRACRLDFVKVWSLDVEERMVFIAVKFMRDCEGSGRQRREVVVLIVDRY